MLMKAGMPGSAAESSSNFPHVRLRRLRNSPQIRTLIQETTVGLADLIYPIFVEEEVDDFGPIESTPGVSRIPAASLLPLAAYQVSGEYAMIKYAAKAGALDKKRSVRETLGAIKRAGAGSILSYFAFDIATEGF